MSKMLDIALQNKNSKQQVMANLLHRAHGVYPRVNLLVLPHFPPPPTGNQQNSLEF